MTVTRYRLDCKSAAELHLTQQPLEHDSSSALKVAIEYFRGQKMSLSALISTT